MKDALKKLTYILQPNRLEIKTNIDKYIKEIIIDLREIVNKIVL